MASVEMSRDYPVDTQQLYIYTTNPRNWATYYNNLLEATGSRFDQAGDTAICRYRILGRAVDVSLEVLEAAPEARLRFVGRTQGLPDTEQDWRYESTATGTRVDVTLHAPEPENWLGRVFDRVVIPRQFEKDLNRTLDNIGELIATGMIQEQDA